MAKKYYSRDKDISAFITLKPDGKMQFIPNKYFRPDDPIEEYIPGSRNFNFYFSALGGLGLGEIKPVPEASGHVFLDENEDIIITTYPIVVEGGMNFEPTVVKFTKDNPLYIETKKRYMLKEIGNGYIIKR